MRLGANSGQNCQCHGWRCNNLAEFATQPSPTPPASGDLLRSQLYYFWCTKMPYNWSLLSILGTWGISMGVHTYGVAVVNTSGRNVYFDNANPRNQWEELRARLPPDVFARSQRAQAASDNGLEILGFWGLAVLAGNLAQLPIKSLNDHALIFLGSRVLYSILYVNISTLKLSALRSLVWGVGIAAISNLLWQSTVALNA
ncbi:hypothetical protein TWF788_004679 [Orbilia oligospora]|uniref:Uncharacterized protein n=1 Tax=Orbilia oligospora TaxID=2813651 RepID=A0A7C8TY11_ORBOL|nr:hypothetical protein TWF788_004679 [Orbilia oligospora]